jgi:hypothetical protein
VFQALAETEAGVHGDAIQGNAGGFCCRHPLPQKSCNLRNDIVVLRIALHGGGLTLHVHQANAGPRGCHRLKGARRPQRIDIIDHVRTSGQYGTHHFGLHRIDGDRHTTITHGLHHRQQALRFVASRNRMRAGAGRLGTNVDDVCTFVDQPMVRRAQAPSAPDRARYRHAT